MKFFRWDPEKSDLLRRERGLGFEQVVVAIEAGSLMQIVSHPNPAKYPRQRIMVVRIDAYAYLVPFVEETDHFFLKTIIPSRKATRDFVPTGASDDDT
jgi:uncharacterized DUF497 family protein